MYLKKKRFYMNTIRIQKKNDENSDKIKYNMLKNCKGLTKDILTFEKQTSINGMRITFFKTTLKLITAYKSWKCLPEYSK